MADIEEEKDIFYSPMLYANEAEEEVKKKIVKNPCNIF
jgi:hypothetical protein